MTAQTEQDKDKTSGGHGGPHGKLDLLIRATNGAGWRTDDFTGNTKVSHVIDKAVQHFVREGTMAPGDYRLARVVDGDARPPLDEDERLEDAGVLDGDVLVLIPREPQVDGCTPI